MTDEPGREVPAPEASRDAPADAEINATVDAAVEESSDDGEVRSPPDVFARRRAELGLSLEDVANQLKFSARQIEALENSDFERLPGGTFVRGMMRSYARLLKLEPAQIVDQLAAASAKPQAALETAVSLRSPIPFSEGGKHVNLVYAILSIVILAVVAFLTVQWYQEKNAAGKLAFVRPAVVEMSSAVVSVQTPGTSQAGGVESPTVTDPPPLASEAAIQPSQTTSRAEENSAIPAIPSVVPAVTTSGSGKRRIVLRFEAQSWVEIKAAKGAILMSQLNQAGSEKTIEGDPPFELIIGNASRVRLTYNDQPVDLKPYFHVDVARLTLN